jgi:hypothetical protein
MFTELLARTAGPLREEPGAAGRVRAGTDDEAASGSSNRFDVKVKIEMTQTAVNTPRSISRNGM